MRQTSLPPKLPAHMSPAAWLTTNGPLPTGILWMTAFVAGSITATEFSASSGIQTVPSEATVPPEVPLRRGEAGRTESGEEPLHDSVSLRIDARDGPRSVVGRPDRTECIRHV